MTSKELKLTPTQREVVVFLNKQVPGTWLGANLIQREVGAENLSSGDFHTRLSRLEARGFVAKKRVGRRVYWSIGPMADALKEHDLL